MVTLFTILFVFFFIVAFIPLSMAAQCWLFQQTGEVVDPEWEIYQQRYD
jgi:hypothetical protein